MVSRRVCVCVCVCVCVGDEVVGVCVCVWHGMGAPETAAPRGPAPRSLTPPGRGRSVTFDAKVPPWTRDQSADRRPAVEKEEWVDALTADAKSEYLTSQRNANNLIASSQADMDERLHNIREDRPPPKGATRRGPLRLNAQNTPGPS